VKRRLGVNNRIVEGIRQNLGGPDQAGLDALDEEQLNHSKQQRPGAHKQPDLADVAHKALAARVRGK